MFPLSPISVMGHFSVGPPSTAHFWPFFTWLDSLSPRYWLLHGPIGPFPMDIPWPTGKNRARYRSNRWIIKCIFACVGVYLSMETTRPSAMTSWSHPASRYILYTDLAISSRSLLRNISNAFLEMWGLYKCFILLCDRFLWKFNCLSWAITAFNCQ